MLARIFGQINSLTNFIIGFYALALIGVHFWLFPNPSTSLTTAFGIIYINRIFLWVLLVVLLVFILFGSQWLLFSRYKLVKHHALIPFFYLPLLLLFLGDEQLTFLLQTALLGVILKTWIDAYQGDNLLRQSLNSGLLIGVGSLLSTQFFLLLLFTYLVYLVYGRLSIRLVVIPLIGYLTIWLISLSLDFLLFDSIYVFSFFKKHVEITTAFQFDLPWPRAALLMVLMLAGLSEFIQTVTHANVFKRQTYSWLFILMLVAALAFLLFGAKDIQISIVIITSTVLFVNYMQYIKRIWLRELAMWVMLALFGIFEAGLL